MTEAHAEAWFPARLYLQHAERCTRADFGYVLGMRDPKQWAKVPVPLKRELVLAMGGPGSPDYKHFRTLAVEAYIILRKHARLLLTLLTCMAGASIECFSSSGNDAAGVSLDFVLSQVRRCPHLRIAC